MAHPLFIENRDALKHYAVHELHHAGFITAKGNEMPSLDIRTYGEMAELIAYCTHLEGMGTYAAFDARPTESCQAEYFAIYNFFKNSPEKTISDDDWSKISILADENRLWYTVGALIAQTIDEKCGRNHLIDLISEPSSNFIETYLRIS